MTDSNITDGDDVRYARSQDGQYYRILSWAYAADGSVVPKVKQEVDREDVPADWLNTNFDRETDV